MQFGLSKRHPDSCVYTLFMSAIMCNILLNSRYQESLGSNVTETELD